MVVPTLADINETFWMPPAASTFAEGIDQTFNLILWINVLYGVPIFVLLFWFLFKYRRKGSVMAEPSPHHSFLLEVSWTIIPTIMVVGIFFQGFVKYIGMTTAPANPYEIQVTAKKWNWTFTYPNGYSTAELHVPDGRPVLLTMRSDDVMHSLYIPAFRVKMDCIPGRYTQLWFEALPIESTDPKATKEFDLFCTEYCGTSHSNMLAKVFVHNSGYFQTWLDDAANTAPFLPDCQAGEILWEQKCKSCHTIDGSNGTGPTWLNVFGTEQEMTSGERVLVDANYLRESILNPNAKIRKGFRGIMPSFQGQLSEDELADLIAFHKSLSPEAPGWTECVKISDEELQRRKDAAKAAEEAEVPLVKGPDGAMIPETDAAAGGTPPASEESADPAGE